MSGPGGVLSNQSDQFLTQFTRQTDDQHIERTAYLGYFNNSQMVAQAMRNAYVDSSNMADDDHVGWAKLLVQVNICFICNKGENLKNPLVSARSSYRVLFHKRFLSVKRVD